MYDIQPPTQSAAKKRKTLDPPEASSAASSSPPTDIVLTAKESLHILTSIELCQLFDKDSDKLLFRTEAGDIQRNVDVEHLADLKDYQQQHMAKFGMYSFSTQIVAAEHEGKYALVDGQHRLETIRYLLDVDFERASHIRVPLLMVQLGSVGEYDDVFVAINKNKPVRLYKNVYDWKKVGKHLEQYFCQHYRPYLKATDTPQVPHLNVDALLRYIDEGDYIQKMGIGFEELLSEIEALNSCYRLHWKELLHVPRYMTNAPVWAEKCEQKNAARPLYLGMFRKFEWVDRILLKVTHPTEYPTYLSMKHVPANYRGRIYKSTRRSVWHKRNSQSLQGGCYVCAKPIHYDDFECGHVVSVFAGGPTSVDNMEPVCRMCNSDMGTDHLEEFKSRVLAESHATACANV
jgi:hypothetical protein